MKLSQIVDHCSLKEVVFLSDEDIKTGYCGDLMSDVIAHADNESIWVTVQAHKNSIAVALIKDIKAIIFTNDVEISQELKEKAKEEKDQLVQEREKFLSDMWIIVPIIGG